MRLIRSDAQRASRGTNTGRGGAILRRGRVLGALLVAVAGLGLIPSIASAASIRVVIVVGPVEGMTSSYISDARALARQARSYGVAVTEIYSPNATWARVSAAAQHANVLIYLGHGNGWPSPYPADPAGMSHDGLGLNAAVGRGNRNLEYYGSSYLTKHIRLASGAVVILNHLCYSAGNSEPWMANPTRMVAKERIANYGAPFLAMGAAAVFAEARDDAGYILAGLFRTKRTFREIFWSAPGARHAYSFTFRSTMSAHATAISDPYAPSRYYRSVIGYLEVPAAAWR